MPYEIHKFRASELWTVEVRPEGRAGVWFLNWALRRTLPRLRSDDSHSLDAPGLYGLTYCDKVVYVGSFIGSGNDTTRATGDIADVRWWTHIGSITSRGYRVHISRRSLAGLKQRLGENHFMVRGYLDSSQPELLHKDGGNLAPLRRLLFAAEHLPEIFKQNVKPSAFLDNFTFVYARATGVHLKVRATDLARQIKNVEIELIRRWSPACNHTRVDLSSKSVNINQEGLISALLSELK